VQVNLTLIDNCGACGNNCDAAVVGLPSVEAVNCERVTQSTFGCVPVCARDPNKRLHNCDKNITNGCEVGAS
jgi:hypothetical protein